MSDDLDLKELRNYYGTENYYPVFGSKVTDGIYYIMNNGYSWFVTDFLVVAKFDEKIKKEPFICVKLKLKDGNKAVMEVSDGNEHILYTQKYDYTNARKELTLYYCDNVLMLSGEY